MRFAEPLWLLVGLATMALLFAMFYRFDLRQRASMAEFASSHLLARLTATFSPRRRRLKRLLYSGAIALVFIALARPQIGYHWEDEKQRGIDILFAIDTSKSMLTQDVAPDRLTRAKLAIIDFVNKLDTDRVGLIAFAGDAFLQAPLTLDYDAFKESLDAVDTNIIPRGGTDIATAIQEGEAAFGADTKNKKILVLVTDGEDLEARGIDAAKTAAQKGLTIYTVGVGSPGGGLIPVPGANGGTDFVKDESGQFVKSHLDEPTLKQIAAATGGIYEPLGQHGEGLDKLYQEALASLPKQDVTSRREKVYDERFQWPLACGLAVLLASMLIGTRRRDVTNDALPQRAARRAVAAGILALATLMTSTAHASPQSAEKSYKNGDFDDAEDEYAKAAEARPGEAPLQFNVGDAAYKAGDFDKAVPAFQKALQTDRIDLQQQSYYNLGNTQFRMGEQAETSKPDDAVKRWQESVQSYDSALNLKPDDADAKFNREFVQKKLDRLQQQQQKKKDQQKKDQMGDDKDQDKSDSQQKGKPDQNQNTQSPNPNQQGKNSADQKGDQGKDQNPGSQGDQANGQKPDQSQTGDQANGQKPGQPQNDQANAQNQQPGPQGQDGKPDQQSPAGQPKDQQGNQQQTAGSQGAPAPNKGEQPANGAAQNPQVAQGQDSSGSANQPKPDKNGGNQQVAGGDADSTTPGVLSREEAKELLNSLKNGEHALPVTADARSGDHTQNQAPLRDW